MDRVVEKHTGDGKSTPRRRLSNRIKGSSSSQASLYVASDPNSSSRRQLSRLSKESSTTMRTSQPPPKSARRSIPNASAGGVRQSVSSAANHQLPVRYTPITGKISRARKGVKDHHCVFPGCTKVGVDVAVFLLHLANVRPGPVHTRRASQVGCDANFYNFWANPCQRRHAANHERPIYTCHLGNCRKPFNRRDLLLRHLRTG